MFKVCHFSVESCEKNIKFTGDIFFDVVYLIAVIIKHKFSRGFSVLDFGK